MAALWLLQAVSFLVLQKTITISEGSCRTGNMGFPFNNRTEYLYLFGVF